MLLSSAYKPNGLFGGFAPTGAKQTPQVDPVEILRQQPGANQMRRAIEGGGGGFFGEGGTGRALAGYIGDALLQMNGMNPIYQPAMNERRQMAYMRQQQQQQMQMQEQQRQNDWQDWLAKEQWQRDNPKPVINDTINDFNWYKGLSPEDQAIYDRLHPITVMGPDGPYAVPRSAIGGKAPIGGAALQSDWDNAKPVGGVGGNTDGGFPVNKATGYSSYQSGSYDPLEAAAGKEYGVPPGILQRLRVKGERSNANQVSEAGARSVYQITPETRNLIIKKYKFDPWSSPANSARGAAIVARDMYRKFGNWNDAMAGYHGGNDTRNWGPRTRAYSKRTKL